MRDTRRTRVVLSLLLLVSLTLVVLNVRGGGDGARSAASGVFGPIENAAATIVRPVSNFLSSITTMGSKDEQIQALKETNGQLQQELDASEYIRSRARQLDDLLRVSGLGRYRTVPAQVIAIGPAQGFARTVTIDAGTRDGVTPEMTVLNGQGLVGKVVQAGATTAIVQLLIDATSTVGARLEGSNKLGLLDGTGESDKMTLTMLDMLTSIKVGDRLVKWATPNSPYVAGVPLGVVTAVGGTPGGSGQVAEVRPYADVSTLDLVGVVLEAPRQDPRDSILPPKPPASAGTSTPPPGPASTSTAPLGQ